MAEDREFLPEDADGESQAETPPGDQEVSEISAYNQHSIQELEQELRALEDDEPAESSPSEDTDELAEDESAGEADQQTAVEQTSMAALAEEERLRQPRAGQFRRRLRNQVGLLPLALLLLGLGVYLIARQQEIEGLPDLSNRVLVEISILAGGFTTFFYALVYGRRDHGLLFIGLWIGSTAGMLGVLVYGIDTNPDAAEWWPLLVWALSLAVLLTYLFEHTHDARLVLLSILLFVVGGAAFFVNSDRADQEMLDQIADYWPLLLSVIGVGMLPLAFRRRTG
ncbi:MAG: hypothetical protein HY866_09160 [Chloroflexi bacterium]|nr:hypothetical protein [Chloroflexota bacterium]